ncbi:MAG TPA: FHA domain-containing protein [Thermoleophilaceae bacterium]|nr:FHA domain-containing protein [Thermoleophilaceae bacterium]
MQQYEAGTLTGTGSFRCEGCGFAISLKQRDEVPSCPSCGGGSFRRQALFTEVEMPPPRAEGEQPDWLAEARDALVAGGEYLAFEDGSRVRVIALQEGWTRIGRSLSAHVRIDDPTVSRRHALVYCGEDGAKVLDDRSLNGVFRNGKQVDLASLEDGNRIAVGRFTLHYIVLAGDREAVGLP